jgi:hypothetical protein
MVLQVSIYGHLALLFPSMWGGRASQGEHMVGQDAHLLVEGKEIERERERREKGASVPIYPSRAQPQ